MNPNWFINRLLNQQWGAPADFFLREVTDEELEELRQKGTVIIQEEKRDGFIGRTITYTSADGLTSWTKHSSRPIVDKNKQWLDEKNKQKEAAVASENYELAGQLKKEIDEFLTNQGAGI